MPIKRVVWAVFIAVPLVLLLAFGFGRDPSVIASPLINHPAPGFTSRTLDGKELSLGSFQGRPVVVNFWASWCLGCKIEHPYLVQAWQDYAPLGVAFVGVVYQDTAGNARTFMKERGGSWPSVLDSEEKTAVDFGVYGVPDTFFIDRKGIIRYKSIGPVSASLLRHDIGSLLRPGGH
jgi:cytochrome c biogenesis protein CcmG/thiol:disulfide interchange protein DsbE